MDSKSIESLNHSNNISTNQKQKSPISNTNDRSSSNHSAPVLPAPIVTSPPSPLSSSSPLRSESSSNSNSNSNSILSPFSPPSNRGPRPSQLHAQKKSAFQNGLSSPNSLLNSKETSQSVLTIENKPNPSLSIQSPSPLPSISTPSPSQSLSSSSSSSSSPSSSFSSPQNIVSNSSTSNPPFLPLPNPSSSPLPFANSSWKPSYVKKLRVCVPELTGSIGTPKPLGVEFESENELSFQLGANNNNNEERTEKERLEEEDAAYADGKLGAVVKHSFYGASMRRGRRRGMEDYFSIVPFLLRKKKDEKGEINNNNGTETINEGEDAFFAVFDGHGKEGRKAAREAAAFLPIAFAQSLNDLSPSNSSFCSSSSSLSSSSASSSSLPPSSSSPSLSPSISTSSPYVSQALANAFSLCDERVLSKIDSGGTTATCVYVQTETRKVWAANVGDSRCVLSKGGKATALSFDHKPGEETEKKRIEKEGGRVLFYSGWRVDGELNVSRSLGDRKWKAYVCSRPFVREHQQPIDNNQFELESIQNSPLPKEETSPPPLPDIQSPLLLSSSPSPLGNSSSIIQSAPTPVSTPSGTPNSQSTSFEQTALIHRHESSGVGGESGIDNDDSEEEILILATDGIWTVMSSQEAVDIVEKIRKNGGMAFEASEALIEEGLKKHSMDNLCVVVVYLTALLKSKQKLQIERRKSGENPNTNANTMTNHQETFLSTPPSSLLSSNLNPLNSLNSNTSLEMEIQGITGQKRKNREEKEEEEGIQKKKAKEEEEEKKEMQSEETEEENDKMETFPIVSAATPRNAISLPTPRTRSAAKFF